MLTDEEREARIRVLLGKLQPTDRYAKLWVDRMIETGDTTGRLMPFGCLFPPEDFELARIDAEAEGR